MSRDPEITKEADAQRLGIEAIAGPDAPVIFNEKGGGQSHLPARFDLVDGKAMFAMAQVLDEGAKKYGENNWRHIDVEDHLNHLIMHAYAYLSGDRSDGHLSHIMCRAMFAQAVEITINEEILVTTATDTPLFLGKSSKDYVKEFEEKPAAFIDRIGGKNVIKMTMPTEKPDPIPWDCTG